MRYGVSILIFFLFSITLLPASDLESSLQPYYDWIDSFDRLLGSNVREGEREGVTTALIDYRAIGSAPLFSTLRRQLRKLPADRKLPPKLELALWINIYNFIIIEKVVDNPDIKSIKDLSRLLQTVWDQSSGTILGLEVSPGFVEHKILRVRYNEPRIHFAIVCASLSCPDLLGEAYRAELIDNQLERQLRLFLGNSSKGMRIDRQRKRVYLSKIFSWFRGDFGGDVKLWLYRRGLIDEDVYKSFTIKYMDYNWNLNAIRQ